MPKLSIITVNLNNAEGLRKTIESVVCQTFTDYEYIIFDGGSSDASVAVIKEYRDKISYWISEPDKGIYNAMNKGIKVAKGDYCLFLNSGDYLLISNSLDELFSYTFNEDIVYCNLKIKDKTIKYPEKLNFGWFFDSSLGHQSMLISRKLFYTVGYYSENLKIVSDWEFFMKAIIINNCKYKRIDLCLSTFDETGISNNKENKNLHNQEREQILRRLFPFFYEDYIEMSKLRRELIPYKNSRIIQKIFSIQQSHWYKKIR